MGQIAHALIDYNLTQEEILSLPNSLDDLSDEAISGNWQWTKETMTGRDLVDSWAKKTEYFINNSWSEKDLVLLQNGSLTLHFLSSKLVTFDCLLNLNVYDNNEIARNKFKSQTKIISSLLKATDTLIVPDLSSVDFFDEDENLSVGAYRQKARGNRMYIREL